MNNNQFVRVTHYIPRTPYPAWCEMGYVSTKIKRFYLHNRDEENWYLVSREISSDELKNLEKEGRIIRIQEPTIMRRCQSLFLSPGGEVFIANREDPWRDPKKILIKKEVHVPSDLQLSAYNSYSI